MISQIKISGSGGAAFGGAGYYALNGIDFSLQRNGSYLLDEIGASRLPAEELVGVLQLAKGLSEIYDVMVRNHTTAQTTVLNWCD